MFQHRVPWLWAPRRSDFLIKLAVLAVMTTSGCYEGEWRYGFETPVSSTSRLIPTRDVERWELSASTVPNVLNVKATVAPRCRYALYGTTRRTDVGHFRRINGGWWSALAVVTGIVGGAGAGFGAGGWFSDMLPDTWGRPVVYAAGGVLAAGGIISCFAALGRPTKVRLSMCGILTGLGGSVIGGAYISSLPGSSMSTSSGSGGMSTTPTSLIDMTTFRTFTFAGLGLVGASIVTGIIGASWRGDMDRERTIETEAVQSWNTQMGEQSCGSAKSLAGRTATLEVTTEYLSDGVGSEGAPLKVRVAVGGQPTQAVDLRPLRKALPSCGALRVQLSPDIMYESYVEEYVPPAPPDQMTALRPGQTARRHLAAPGGDESEQPAAAAALVPALCRPRHLAGSPGRRREALPKRAGCGNDPRRRPARRRRPTRRSRPARRRR